MATRTLSVAEICAAAKKASRALAAAPTGARDAALLAMASGLEGRMPEILEANERDMRSGEENDIGAALLDRLRLTKERILGIAADVRSIVALPDPVGETIEGHRLPNGLDLRKVRVPLGVVAVVYEARPNVTIDCSALCLKSGNDHVFVDASANLDDAVAITVNAKVQRPGVCNAAETLLVHSDIAPEFLPRVLGELRESGVELRVDGRTRALAGSLADSLNEASEDDWATEFLALVLAVKVVDSVDEAIDHVNRYGSGHSEAIVTGSIDSAQAFTQGVDAACVYVNASTRFTDGGQFGMGAEIGNSTQKLHARGPIGVRELCTFKYVIEGSGQVRP